MDAQEVSQSYGIVAGQSVTYAVTPESVRATMGAASNTAMAYASSGVQQDDDLDTRDGQTKKKESV